MKKGIQFIFFGVLLQVMHISASADESENGVKFALGGFFPTIDTVIHVENNVAVDFETDLKMDETDTQPIVFLGYRFHQRHFLALEYFSLNRNGVSQAIQKEFDYDGTTVTVGAQTNSTLNMDIYRLIYDYRFIDKEQWTLSGIIGVHTLDIEFDLTAKLGGVGLGVEDGEIASESQAAPLPNLGLNVTYKPFERWGIVAGFGWLDVGVEGYSGSMMQYEMGLFYSLAEHWKIFTTYNYFDVKFKEESTATGETVWDFEFKYRGPELVLEYTF